MSPTPPADSAAPGARKRADADTELVPVIKTPAAPFPQPGHDYVPQDATRDALIAELVASAARERALHHQVANLTTRAGELFDALTHEKSYVQHLLHEHGVTVAHLHLRWAIITLVAMLIAAASLLSQP